MGFGICSLGYLMIIFDSMGGGIVGWPLLAFGFWKLSSVNRNFRTASVLSVLALGYSAVNLFAILGYVSDEGILYKISYAAYLAIMVSLHFSFMMAIRQTARKGGSEKLANGAASRLYLTEVFYLWALIIIFIPSINTGTFSMLLIITRYCVGFVNFLFLYTCFAQITTASQAKKDMDFINSQEKKEAEKQTKRHSGRDKK